MSDMNLDHADLLEASGKYRDEDFDSQQERENYERWLDELYQKDREQRRSNGNR